MIDRSWRPGLLVALAAILTLQVIVIPVALISMAGTPWQETVLGTSTGSCE